MQWSWQMCTTPKLAGLDDDITRCDEPNTWGFTLDDGAAIFLAAKQGDRKLRLMLTVSSSCDAFLCAGPNCSHNAVRLGRGQKARQDG